MFFVIKLCLINPFQEFAENKNASRVRNDIFNLYFVVDFGKVKHILSESEVSEVNKLLNLALKEPWLHLVSFEHEISFDSRLQI